MTGEEQFKELYRRYIHREGAEELLEWMERETDFFTAPASTKHHLAYPGGLVEHSVNVFRELRKVVIDNEPTMEAVAICALLHDLCKANTYVREHHAGPGEVYSYVKKDSFPMGHGEKSVYLIARFMKLEDEEALAIRTASCTSCTRRICGPRILWRLVWHEGTTRSAGPVPRQHEQQPGP